MAGKGGQRKGLGFGAGVITGLAFSAVVLSGLSLSVPLEQAPDEAVPETAPAPEDEAARPETVAEPETAVMGEAAPAADDVPAEGDGAPAATDTLAQADDEPAPAADGPEPAPSVREVAPTPETEETETAAVAPATEEPAAVSQAEEAPETEADPAPETTAAAEDEAPMTAAPVEDEAQETVAAVEPPAEAASVEPLPREAEAVETVEESGPAEEPVADAAEAPADPVPEAEPAQPAWRANAAMADLVPDEPVMTVIVTGARAATLPALTTLAPLSAVTVAIDLEAEDRAGLATALRALGHEVLETVSADAPALSVPLSAGLAVQGVADMAAADAVLATAEASGALAVDLLRGEASPLVEAGRAARQPVAGAALRITAARTATEAFQTLRDAGALAVQEGTLVVALEASPATLTALGRWLALPGDVQPAPLSALIGRLGATRY